jgi:hypothetical protein
MHDVLPVEPFAFVINFAASAIGHEMQWLRALDPL